MYAGVHWGSTTAGGADSYGYVSQAGLWLGRQLTVQQDIVRSSPWPLAAETWAPLGYRASSRDREAIVPLYAPGLPLAMAALQAIGGFCAAFIVVPLTGALAVWVTYALGLRLFHASRIGLAAAVLVATSPIFLYQLMNPMSDVPATAAWALALWLAVLDLPLAAGAAAGAALLIRPNLIPLAGALLLWLALSRGRWLSFLAGLVPFALAVAAINASLYESPLVSGYGRLADLYSASYVITNVRQFSSWMLTTQTAIVLAPLLYFAAPHLYPLTAVRRPRMLLAGVAAAVVLSYLFYLPFDAWWYLRFLLPLWPIMMILTAASLDALARLAIRASAVRVVLLAAAVALLAANGIRIANARYAFDIGRAERRYIDVARFVTSRTEPEAVMIALQHSGTLRMYAGRLTLRFDQLDPLWLDRAIVFLQARGRHPYIVVEGGERALFAERFGAATETGRLDWRPFGRLAGADVAVYDPLDRVQSGEPLAIGAAASRRTGWRCDPPYVWPTPLRTK